MQIRRHCHSWAASDIGTQPSPPLIYKAVWDPQLARKTYQREYFYPHRVLNPGSPVNQTYLFITLMSSRHSSSTRYQKVVAPTAGTTGFILVAASLQQTEKFKQAKYLVPHTEIYSNELRNTSSKLSFQITCNAVI